MRTTIDIPDELYRSLKVRAALSGVPMRDVVARLLDLGLRSAAAAVASASDHRRMPPPVAIPPRGVPIAALSHEEIARAEESEDESKIGRSA